jgi:hypothetical protein
MIDEKTLCDNGTIYFPQENHRQTANAQSITK